MLLIEDDETAGEALATGLEAMQVSCVWVRTVDDARQLALGIHIARQRRDIRRLLAEGAQRRVALEIAGLDDDAAISTTRTPVTNEHQPLVAAILMPGNSFELDAVGRR